MQKWVPSLDDQNSLIRFINDQSKSQLIAKIVSAAQDHLQRLSMDPVFDGYESGSEEKVHHQVQAIYETFFDGSIDIVWSIEPTDNNNEPMKQYIRSVEEILSGKRADCIDTVCLLASILLRVGIKPLVVIVGPSIAKVTTHAILGYWLEEVNCEKTVLKWEDEEFSISKTTFLESTGILRGNRFGKKLPFLHALSSALLSLPKSSRKKIITTIEKTLKISMRDYIEKLAVSPDFTVFYIVNVCGQISVDIPVISVMGAKGGVGKTLISARMAELIAQSGKNVLVIDFDLEKIDGGLTGFYRRKSKSKLKEIKTAYDHFSAYPEPSTNISFDEGLWQITPAYLQLKNLGQIFMIPARPRGALGGWDVVANVSKDSSTRNQILLRETERLIKRAKNADVDIDCVIIDCGAGTNPIFSAAFSLAKYTFIVATPDQDSLKQIEPIIKEHMARFKNIKNADVILNRVSTQNEMRTAMTNYWSYLHPIGFISENPTLQEHYFLDNVNFDTGYDDFSLEVFDILNKTFDQNDRKNLLPDEIHVWILPWWNEIIEGKVAKKILSSRSFRTIGTAIVLSFSADLLALCSLSFMVILRNTTNLYSDSLVTILIGSGFIASVFLFPPLLINFRNLLKKRRLLLQLANLGEDKSKSILLLKQLLSQSRESENKSLNWLKSLLNDKKTYV